MLVCCADIRALDNARPLLAGRGGRAPSGFARSLLLVAAWELWGWRALPEVAYRRSGRPYFPAEPQRYFSLSHTRTHVLAAVAEVPVGADVETARERPAQLWQRLMNERERRDFEPYELWCLRESCYKLMDGGDLRTMPFRREGGRIAAPVEGVSCRLYRPDEGCFAAACALGAEPPEGLLLVPPREICS